MKRSIAEHFKRRVTRMCGYQLEPLRMLIIEPTNICTAKCPVCGAAEDLPCSPRGYMDWSLFIKVLDESMKMKPEKVFLYAHGEPLLHSRIYDMITEVHRRGMQCEIVTNGDLLTVEAAKKLKEARLDSLAVSHPALTLKNYEACRGVPPASGCDERLRAAMEEWGDCGGKLSLKAMMIPGELAPPPEDVAAYMERWLSVPYLDSIEFHGYISWPRHNCEEYVEILSSSPSRCENAMTTLLVLWDGKVTPCSYDFCRELIAGDATKMTIPEIYNSTALKKIRKLWFGRHTAWPDVCSTCLIPRTQTKIVLIRREDYDKMNADGGHKAIVRQAKIIKAGIKPRVPSNTVQKKKLRTSK